MKRIIPIRPVVQPLTRTPSSPRIGADLTRWPVLGAALRRGHFMTGIRVLFLAGLAVAILTGLLLDDAATGFAVLLMWGVFWPLLTSVVTPTLGNAFCAVCPHGFVGKWLSRVGLRRRFPRRLRGVWGGLVLVLLGYWVIAYAMPGFLTGSTRTTAVYFLLFTLAAFATFFVFRDMAWCKHLCPLGRVLAIHGRVGALHIRTEQQSCSTCTSFDCARACSYHLSPFVFDTRNNMDACTLCTDCVGACDAVHLSFRTPSRHLARRMLGQDRNEVWVLLAILAVAGVGIQFMHGLAHTVMAPHLPWIRAGDALHALLPIDPELFDLRRLLAMLSALALTLAAGIFGYRRAARLANADWRTTANTLAIGLAPLAIIGLIPHAVMRFTTSNAHALANESAALLGLGWALSPFAQRGDAWLSVLHWLPWFGMAWTAWLIFARARLLSANRRSQWSIWLWGGLPAWLYVGVVLIKLGVQMIEPSTGAHTH